MIVDCIIKSYQKRKEKDRFIKCPNHEVEDYKEMGYIVERTLQIIAVTNFAPLEN